MAQPRLIHPVPVTIEQLDLAETIQDDDYREPVQQAARKAKVTSVKGQPRWEGSKELEFTKGGVQQKADGYVLFRYVDLEAAGVTLSDNDRFTLIGKQVTDVYIVQLQPVAHYSDKGGATLLKAFFMDRQPSRQGLAT
jgi:hypothetical protein